MSSDPRLIEILKANHLVSGATQGAIKCQIAIMNIKIRHSDDELESFLLMLRRNRSYSVCQGIDSA